MPLPNSSVSNFLNQKSGKDPYKISRRPRCVVLVGEVPVQPISVSMQMNNELEQDICTIVLNEHIVSDDTNNKLMKSDFNRMPVEVWCGYMPETYTNDDDEYKVYAKDSQDYKNWMFMRFQGIVSQPHWKYGLDGDILTLECQDYTTILTEVTITQKAEDTETTCAAVIDKLNKVMSSANMKIEYNSPNDQKIAQSVRLGSQTKGKDGKTKYHYSMANKTAWSILQDVVKNCHFDLVKRGQTVFIGNPLNSKAADPKKPNRQLSNDLTQWKFIYGKHFTELEVRKGQKGQNQNGQVFIKITSSIVQKKKSKQTQGTFPTNKKIDESGSDVILIQQHYQNKTDAQCAAIAKFIGTSILRKTMTATMTCPFGYPYLNPDDGALFFSDDPNTTQNNRQRGDKLKHLEGIPFRIKSISEEFSMNGYSQNLEFDLEIKREALNDPDLQKLISTSAAQIQRRKVTPPKGKKPIYPKKGGVYPKPIGPTKSGNPL